MIRANSSTPTVVVRNPATRKQSTFIKGTLVKTGKAVDDKLGKYLASSCKPTTAPPSSTGAAGATPIDATGRPIQTEKLYTCKGLTGTTKPFTVKTIDRVKGAVSGVNAAGKAFKGYSAKKCTPSSGAAGATGAGPIDATGRPIQTEKLYTCKGLTGTTKPFTVKTIDRVKGTVSGVNAAGKAFKGYSAKKCTPSSGAAGAAGAGPIDATGSPIQTEKLYTCKGLTGTTKPFTVKTIDRVKGTVSGVNAAGKAFKGYSAKKCTPSSGAAGAARAGPTDATGNPIQTGNLYTCKGLTGTTKPFTVETVDRVKGSVSGIVKKTGKTYKGYSAKKCTPVQGAAPRSGSAPRPGSVAAQNYTGVGTGQNGEEAARGSRRGSVAGQNRQPSAPPKKEAPKPDGVPFRIEPGDYKGLMSKNKYFIYYDPFFQKKAANVMIKKTQDGDYGFFRVTGRPDGTGDTQILDGIKSLRISSAGDIFEPLLKTERRDLDAKEAQLKVIQASLSDLSDLRDETQNATKKDTIQASIDRRETEVSTLEEQIEGIKRSIASLEELKRSSISNASTAAV